MSPRLPSLFHLLAIGLLATGCASSREQTYHVTVVNEAGAPVTLWIAKEGQPFEAHWSTPSQWQSAREAGAIPDDAPSLGVELPPARRVELGPQSGRFRRDARAVLYVFSAPVSLEEMAATPRRAPCSRIAESSVTRIRAPLQPIG